MNSTITRRNAGYSLIELMVVMAIIAILAATAISNFDNVRQQSLDTVALSDYRNLKTVMLDEAAQPDAPLQYLIRNIEGPGHLPAPLEMAKLSKNVRLIRARRRTRPATARQPRRELIRIDLEHINGRWHYRYVSRDGAIVEQLIQRR